MESLSVVSFDNVNEPSQIFPHPLKVGLHLHNRLGPGAHANVDKSFLILL